MERNIICWNCGSDVAKREITMVGGNVVCPTCLETDYFTCEYDGVTIAHNDDAIEVHYRTPRYPYYDTKFICRYNYERNAFIRTLNDEVWDECECIYVGDEGGWISQIDYENGDYFTCEDCDEVFHYENRAHSDEDYVCHSCYENSQLHATIHDYNYKPIPVFYTMPDETKSETIGWEIEIDGRNGDYVSDRKKSEVAKFVKDTMQGATYNKRDGSLHANGFEIVSHPMTYRYLQSVRDKLQDVFTYATNNGYAAHETDTCGLHIHISRRAFVSEVAINNFVYLFEKFYDQVLKFSRRTPSTMRRWADRYGIYDRKDKNSTFASKLVGASREKYRIVNLLHSNTLEVRAFRGTLNMTTFFASVQFMLVMKELANCVDGVVNNVQWGSIVKLARVRGYDELTQYLAKRGLNDEKFVKPEPIKSLTITRDTKFIVTSTRYHNIPLGVAVCVHLSRITPNSDVHLDVRYFVNRERSMLRVAPINEADIQALSHFGESQILDFNQLSVASEGGELVPISEFDVSFDISDAREFVLS